MADRTGQQIGKYILQRLLGEGGFAEVYLGEHVHLGTLAAVKLLHTQIGGNEVDTFRAEARNVARLQHPNIVRVLDFDVEEKTPYLVMDYASKGTLRQAHPKGQRVPLVTVVNYVKQIADALQCAHDEKLVHRDVKPENILVGRRGELLLSDFGIALIAQSTRYQGTQDMTGTIGYMSPEQIQGKPRSASDQYSLAVAVYEWLTGEKPFTGGFIEIVAQHMTATPSSIREKVPDIPADFERVVLIALEKDYTKRFGSITAFAKALEQASTGNIVKEEKPAPAPRPVVETISSPPVRVPKKVVQKVPVTPSPSVGTVFRTRTDKGKISSLSWATDVPALVIGSDDRFVKIWNVYDNVYDEAIQQLRGVRAVVVSQDNSQIVTSCDDKRVRVFRVQGMKSPFLFYQGHTGFMVNSLTYSPDERFVATASDDYTVKIWNVDTTDTLITYNGHSGWVGAVSWTTHGNRIASAGYESSVHIWNASSGTNLYTYRGHSHSVRAVAWSPDGRKIVSGGHDKVLQVWDATSGAMQLQGYHIDTIHAVAWSPSGTYVASASGDRTGQVWNVNEKQKVFTYKHSASVRAVAWSPDGKYIASGGDDKTVQVWVAPS